MENIPSFKDRCRNDVVLNENSNRSQTILSKSSSHNSKFYPYNNMSKHCLLVVCEILISALADESARKERKKLLALCLLASVINCGWEI